MVALLLDRVADPDARTRSGYSALNLARDQGGEGAARILLAHGVATGARAFPPLSGPYLGQSSPGERPKPFALDIVAGPYEQHGNITFSPDGQRVYFLSSRPLVPGQEEEKENVWMVMRRGEGWGEPEPLPPCINRFEHHWQVSAAANGNLYFHGRTTTQETKGLYRARFVNGRYEEPEPLGIDELMPYVAPDESYLITFTFAEPHERNLIRFRRDDGTWGPPVDLTAATGGAVMGTCPVVSPDERYLFLVRPTYESDDTWWVEADVIAELRKRSSG